MTKGQERESTGKRHEILFGVTELYLDCDSGYTTINNYKNSSVCVVKMGDFLVCKLYLKKLKKIKTKAKIIYKIFG